MNRRFWFSAAALAAVVTVALAQGGGGRGGQRGGGAALLNRPDVAKELNLTDAQKSEISSKLPAVQGRGGAGGGGQGGQGGGAEARAQQLATIKGILDAKQFARFQELELQRSGATAVARPDVAEKLGLKEDQLAKIREINQAQQEELRSLRQGSGGDRTQMQEARAKMRAEGDKKILAVLTDAQQKAWTAMLGKPFKFEDGQ